MKKGLLQGLFISSLLFSVNLFADNATQHDWAKPEHKKYDHIDGEEIKKGEAHCGHVQPTSISFIRRGLVCAAEKLARHDGFLTCVLYRTYAPSKRGNEPRKGYCTEWTVEAK